MFRFILGVLVVFFLIRIIRGILAYFFPPKGSQTGQVQDSSKEAPDNKPVPYTDVKDAKFKDL